MAADGTEMVTLEQLKVFAGKRGGGSSPEAVTLYEYDGALDESTMSSVGESVTLSEDVSGFETVVYAAAAGTNSPMGSLMVGIHVGAAMPVNGSMSEPFAVFTAGGAPAYACFLVSGDSATVRDCGSGATKSKIVKVVGIR